MALFSLTKDDDYASRKAAIARQEKLAEMLSQMGAQEQAVSTAGGITAPMSGMGALARGLTSFGGSYLSGKAAADEAGLEKSSLAEALKARKGLSNFPGTKGQFRVSDEDPGTIATPMEMDMPTILGQEPSGEKVKYTLDMPNMPKTEIGGGARPYEDQIRLLDEYDLSSNPAMRQMATSARGRIEAENLYTRGRTDKASDAALLRSQKVQDETKDQLTPEQVATYGFRPGTVASVDSFGNVTVDQEPDTMSKEALRQKLQIAAAGRAKTDTAGGDLVLGKEDDLATGITGQTGLPLQAFAVLTGNAGSLPRDARTRSAAFSVANQFLQKRGVDAAGFASRYKANTDTLQKNIARVNQVEIMQDELVGTIENLTPIADAVRLGKLRVGNALAIAAGKEIDSPQASEYGFQLQQLRTELAGYNAALQGRSGNNIFVQDQLEADRLIKDGLSTGGISGIKKALQDSTAKMKPVLDKNVDKAQKRIWELFGVGDKYKNKYDDAPVANVIPTISSADGYAALKSGTIYKDPQGNTRTKP